MYFVDRKKIEHHLVYLGSLHQQAKKLAGKEGDVEKLALERAAHVIIESMIDVGNSMIDGFIMRDPGSYEDILDILEDEKVITAQNAKGLKKVVSLRKMLVQHFASVSHSEISEVLLENSGSIESFPADVRRYIEQELGPVSAFLPEEEQK
ncbi:DUF86 domain-containing protein [Fictibacillus sp. WQ 8-8]|uniref:DUF86 domain-containing protein n=1 Tax=Fictibacillus sp. WQ 8-8 TaxID=2938788 RepID=UPI00210A753A|nr:DUF86 domain-containing protein [Fictibacillus sp. WQ 8-8]MCQ6267981.1 DUF86 domain-containing protein [Fictibacillus sp. WQ 8-8]